MAFQSIADMLKAAKEKELPLWRILYEDDLEDTKMDKVESLAKMSHTYQAMKNIYETYDPSQISNSGLVGGDGAKMEKSFLSVEAVCGEFIVRVMVNALKMA